MTPVICTATLAWAECPVVATFHASGKLTWNAIGEPVWGFLMNRIDHRIAVTEAARESALRWYGGDYELIPNGVLIPPEADPAGRENRIVLVGRRARARGDRLWWGRNTGVPVRAGPPRGASSSRRESRARWRGLRPSCSRTSRDGRRSAPPRGSSRASGTRGTTSRAGWPGSTRASHEGRNSELAGRSRDHRARRRVRGRRALLVARAGLGDGRPRVRHRALGVGRPRDRSQPRLGARAGERLADRDRAGDAAAAPTLPARVLGFLGRPVRECGAAGPDRRARTGRRADAEAPAAGTCQRNVGRARRDGLRAPALRSRPDHRPDPLRAADGEDPALGDLESRRGRRDRSRPVHVRLRERPAPEPVGARRARAGPP